MSHPNEYLLTTHVLPSLDDAIRRLEYTKNNGGITRGMSVALTNLETSRLWLQNELIAGDAK